LTGGKIGPRCSEIDERTIKRHLTGNLANLELVASSSNLDVTY